VIDPPSQRSALDTEIEAIAPSESYADPVRRLSCLRGIKELSALTLLVEVGDFARFATARDVICFTGLRASVHHNSSERSSLYQRDRINRRLRACRGC
jgi:transposase